MANGAPRLTLGQFLMAMYAEKLPPQEIAKGRRWYVENALKQDPEWATLTKAQQKEYERHVLHAPAPDIWYEETARARGQTMEQVERSGWGTGQTKTPLIDPFEAAAMAAGGGLPFLGTGLVRRNALAGLTYGLSEVPALAKALAQSALLRAAGGGVRRFFGPSIPGTAARAARRAEVTASPLAEAVEAGFGAAGRELGAAQRPTAEAGLEEFQRLLREWTPPAPPPGAAPGWRGGGLPPARRILRDPATGEIIP